jgi:hypothetical protein
MAERPLARSPARSPRVERGADSASPSARSESLPVKTNLTPEEKLRAAAAKVIFGTSDAEIALILGGDKSRSRE